MRLPLAAAFAVTHTQAARAADPRGDNPDAAPQTPEQERAQFHLPPGFEIELVAAEPDIQKPINLNFDAAGRIWVTGSELYPWPASVDAAGKAIPDFQKSYADIANAFGTRGKEPAIRKKATDTVRVLSDFDATGRAGKVEVFADGLNIPGGVEPLPRAPGAKGDTVIVYSIPYIWRLEDRDGDGRADYREPLYGPFGFLDTHGGSSSYIQWMDGWIYGTHGFRNHSDVRNRTGAGVVLDSGNTYRFKADGSAFEYYTHGQTNPFGLAFDPLGNLYSADSHSKPVYMLLRGGYYEGIGKQHDGLGFAPRITDDDHGSSAIAGIAYYAGAKFPAEYQGNLFNGNPVTRRVNRDRLEWYGSTPRAIRQPDFVTCDDQWFRPVQVKLGPDGALYIADFYNAIIGHYEFPLADPRRDHTHGRIWRITYRGQRAPLPNIAQLDAAGLIAQLASPNLELRRLATNELVERVGKEAIEPLKAVVTPARIERVFTTDPTTLRHIPSDRVIWASTAPQRVAALEALNRLQALDDATLAQACVGEREVQVAAVKLIAERQPSEAMFGLLTQLWRGGDPMVQRVAIGAISDFSRNGYPSASSMGTLTMLAAGLGNTDRQDAELYYTCRMTLRNVLLGPNGFNNAQALLLQNPEFGAACADAALGAATPEGAQFIAAYLSTAGLRAPRLLELARHAARYCSEEQFPQTALFLQSLASSGSVEQRLALANSLAEGARSRGAQLPPTVQAWLEATAIDGLGDTELDVVKSALLAVRDLKTEAKRLPLSTFVTKSDLRRDVRVAALEAAANLPRAEEIFAPVLMTPGDTVVRRRAAELLGQIDSDAARATLAQALATAPADVATPIAGALVQRETGARLLVDTIAAGKGSPMVLRNKLVAMMIERKSPELMRRVDELTAGLPSEDARLNGVIASRADGFERAAAGRGNTRPLNPARGAEIFKQTCAVCHRFRDEGGNVGPNLDGVAARGVNRLVEDILDPNRNVDPAFRQTILETNDGRTIAGVNPRQEGDMIVVNDVTGAAVSVPSAQVKERKTSPLSLMPPAFEQLLSPDDLNDLLAYLLGVKR
jgi:putative heme-binding domain-containing protein